MEDKHGHHIRLYLYQLDYFIFKLYLFYFVLQWNYKYLCFLCERELNPLISKPLYRILGAIATIKHPMDTSANSGLTEAGLFF